MTDFPGLEKRETRATRPKFACAYEKAYASTYEHHECQ